MSLRVETVRDPLILALAGEAVAEQLPGYEGDEERVLVLDYDEAVVIEGDLETFARRVWGAVFGDQDPVAGLAGSHRLTATRARHDGDLGRAHLHEWAADQALAFREGDR